MIYIFPFMVGCSIVLAMVQNGRLADYIGLKSCTLINFMTGVTGALILLIVTREAFFSPTDFNGMPAIGYIGGLLGIFIVTTSTIVVSKLPIITSSMLMYTGQLAMGIIIDAIMGTPLSIGKIAGCILIVIGVYFNSFVDKYYAKQDLAEQTSSSLLEERLLD